MVRSLSPRRCACLLAAAIAVVLLFELQPSASSQTCQDYRNRLTTLGRETTRVQGLYEDYRFDAQQYRALRDSASKQGGDQSQLLVPRHAPNEG